MFSFCLVGHAIFKLMYLSNHDYKPLYFESDAATVNEIVLKVSSAAPPPLMIGSFLTFFYAYLDKTFTPFSSAVTACGGSVLLKVN